MSEHKKNIFMKHSEKYGRVFEEEITEKRRETNPYISKVEEHPYILLEEEKIFDTAGNWKQYFQNEKEVVLEIWTGLGNFFSRDVAENPDKNYVWIEIKYKRLYVTAEKTLKNGAENFVLLKTKWQNIRKVFWENEIAKTYIFFPDPWGKKDRQKKHRIFQEPFINDLYAVTKPWGKLIFKTDHREYFDTTLEIFAKLGIWKIDMLTHDYEAETELFDKTKKTEFETIFNEKKVCYVEFTK